MAAPSFVRAAAGVYEGSASVYTAVNAVAAAVGDLIAVHVVGVSWSSGGDEPAVDAAGSTGIANLAGTNDALTWIATAGSPDLLGVGGAHWIGLGRATATTVTIAITRGSGTGHYSRGYVFSAANAGTTLAAVIENGSAGAHANGTGTTATVSDTGVQTLGPDRLAVQFLGIRDDNAVANFSGETNGDWVEAVAEFTNTSGNPDGCLQLQTATIAAATTIDGGTLNMGAADGWGCIGFAIIPVGGQTYEKAGYGKEHG